MSDLSDLDIELLTKNDNEKDDDKEKDTTLLIKSNKDNNNDNDIKIEEEDKKKEDNNIKINDNDANAQDKLLLIDMGFNAQLVDRIYKKVFPTNIEEAIDYLQKDDKDKFTHSYIADALNVCSICGNPRTAHAGESLLYDLVNRDRERQRERERSRLSSNNKFTSNKYSYNYGKKECGVCSDEISGEDLVKVKIPCKHNFCIDCWTEYLKEKINNANVYKIHCMDHKCGYILEEKFINSIIGKDSTLKEKYDKFLARKKVMDSKKNIKCCPIPDCDGYAEKKKSKVVKCNFGHEFCFDCGQPPHGKKKCSKVIDEGFEEWKSHTLVKRCPYCKYWTEKNEGCNHMTCSQCNFQWCWVCEQECVAGHYSFGRCKGLHFESVKSNEMAKRLIKENCDFCCVISWILTNFVYLLIYLFMMPCFYLAVLGIKHLTSTNGFIIFVYSISFLPFFICFEVWSIVYITILSIPGIIICPYMRFLKYILFGKILGELFPV